MNCRYLSTAQVLTCRPQNQKMQGKEGYLNNKDKRACIKICTSLNIESIGMWVVVVVVEDFYSESINQSLGEEIVATTMMMKMMRKQLWIATLSPDVLRVDGSRRFDRDVLHVVRTPDVRIVGPAVRVVQLLLAHDPIYFCRWAVSEKKVKYFFFIL